MKSQEGFILVEMVLAIFILGMVAASYFSAQATAFKSSFYIKERSNALTIAQSEDFSGDEQYPGVIGYVHKQTYNTAPWWYGVTTANVSKSAGLSFTPAVLAATYAGYTVNVTASALSAPYNADIQQITVVVAHSRPEGKVDIVSYVGYNTNMGTR
ncbi:MAG: hypothetical protein HW402_746 [Dehalococcoidales bacterium]|nr:hypothetical protein [Dehalococcoidales bacterium]